MAARASKAGTPATLPEWLSAARNTNWTLTVRLHVTGKCGKLPELCRLCRGKLPADCGGKMPTRREVQAAIRGQRAAEREAKRGKWRKFARTCALRRAK